jgi:hypothetical protein
MSTETAVRNGKLYTPRQYGAVAKARHRQPLATEKKLVEHAWNFYEVDVTVAQVAAIVRDLDGHSRSPEPASDDDQSIDLCEGYTGAAQVEIAQKKGADPTALRNAALDELEKRRKAKRDRAAAARGQKPEQPWRALAEVSGPIANGLPPCAGSPDATQASLVGRLDESSIIDVEFDDGNSPTAEPLATLPEIGEVPSPVDDAPERPRSKSFPCALSEDSPAKRALYAYADTLPEVGEAVLGTVPSEAVTSEELLAEIAAMDGVVRHLQAFDGTTRGRILSWVGARLGVPR